MTKDQNMKLNAAYLAMLLLLGVAPAVCPAQNFSADVVFVDGQRECGLA